MGLKIERLMDIIVSLEQAIMVEVKKVVVKMDEDVE